MSFEQPSDELVQDFKALLQVITAEVSEEALQPLTAKMEDRWNRLSKKWEAKWDVVEDILEEWKQQRDEGRKLIRLQQEESVVLKEKVTDIQQSTTKLIWIVSIILFLQFAAIIVLLAN